jgi:hydroxymethylbilane synthase
MPRTVRLATRGSDLARWQARHVAQLLEAAHPGLETSLVMVETTGDKQRDVAVWRLGGQGVFVKEVELAVLEGSADLAVHSAKDLPSRTEEGLRLVAVPERGDPRDALVGSTLDGLASGARVGTGSVRRRAQLAWLRPDLTFEVIRGNIATRVARASGLDAVVVAMAAMIRTNMADRVSEVLDTSTMLPQIGQGALAVECREADEDVAQLAAAIEHAPSRAAVDSERAFLARLGGGCDLPVGAYATATAEGGVRIDGMIASPDGRVLLRRARDGDGASPEQIGEALAAGMIRDAGGLATLDWEPVDL